MMKRFVLVLLLLSTFTLQSQTFEIGLYGGLSYYDGDLAPNRLELYFQTLHPAGGALLRANVAPWLSFRLGYTNMTLSGDDALSGRNRGLNFETNINEFALSGELNLFQWHLFNTDFFVEPYLYGGAAVFHFSPTAEYERQTYQLQPLGTEGQGLPGYEAPYELWQWAALGGGGIKLHLDENWILGFEGSGRITFTDHLDDVSGVSIVYQDILEGNGELAARLSRPSFDPEKGDPTRPYRRGGPARDYFFTVGATITYLFGEGRGLNLGGSKIPCPQF